MTGVINRASGWAGSLGGTVRVVAQFRHGAIDPLTTGDDGANRGGLQQAADPNGHAVAQAKNA
jgi:hypothetical protein